jgi:glycolate oxidase subunit GlcD
MNARPALVDALAAIVGADHVQAEVERRYLEEEIGNEVGEADALCFPGTAEEVAAVVAHCYANDVPIVPRGGGTGLAGGAVPHGGAVVSLERLTRIRQFDPLLWRIQVEAGLPTQELRRVVRESGLFFPPDPGASEQSLIGGNLATNAGGPHALKYGVTGRWVTGVEAVLAPGELVTLGGSTRKDVAGYDLTSLLVGSEGTLGIITAAWLRLIPAPEASFPVVGFYRDTEAGCEAIERVIGSGIEAAALEYFDRGTFEITRGSFPGRAPDDAFVVIAEADGSASEAARVRAHLVEVLGEGSIALQEPDDEPIWHWREGISHAVAAKLGAKIAEDVAVPVDRLAEAVELTVEIGRRHGLESVSWGHGGDGNLHSNFLYDPAGDGLARVGEAVAELLPAIIELGGTITGEHGIGSLKLPYLGLQLSPPVMGALGAIKQALDPKGLFNPGKVVAP